MVDVAELALLVLALAVAGVVVPRWDRGRRRARLVSGGRFV